MIGYPYVWVSKLLAIAWLGIFTSLVTKTSGQAAYTLDQNEDMGNGLYVGVFQAGHFLIILLSSISSPFSF